MSRDYYRFKKKKKKIWARLGYLETLAVGKRSVHLVLIDGGRAFKPTARKDLNKVSIRAITACHCFEAVALDNDAMGLRSSMPIIRRCELKPRRASADHVTFIRDPVDKMCRMSHYKKPSLGNPNILHLSSDRLLSIIDQQLIISIYYSCTKQCCPLTYSLHDLYRESLKIDSIWEVN